MLETYRKLIDLLSPRERRRFYILLVVVLVMGLVETASVASIFPFMAVLARPEVVESNGRLASLYHGLGFSTPRAFLIFLGLCVFGVIVFGLVFRTIAQYAIYRFGSMRGHTVSANLLQVYLSHPYTWFLNRHSANLGESIMIDSHQVIGGALIPAMRLLAQAVIVLFMISLMVVVRPMAALVAAVVLGGSYTLIYVSVRGVLARSGARREEAAEACFQIAGEAIGGIKDVKLMGLERAYLARFERPSMLLAQVTAASAVIGEVPRVILEGVSFGGMLLFILFLLMTGDGTLGGILPVLGIYAFAGMRLFPALQAVYAATTSMRFTQATLEKLHRDMIENRLLAAPPAPEEVAPLHLNQRLELAQVQYAYPLAERPALRGLDLSIAARSTVGIVGGTGAGKTTAVDVILGLLQPQQGTLSVDGTLVTAANLRAWQNAIGYVPQQIFLTDDTVSGNIAFGIEPEDIDQAAVERAARLAELHEFVVNDLAQGYDTKVGERGIRLSGGQRQRIGIARALYHDPDVLILDEATSALDNLTERAVMDAVHNLGHAKTIIMIAHRLTTVRSCDVIFMLEHGRVVASGSYDELLDRSQKFRAMAGGQG